MDKTPSYFLCGHADCIYVYGNLQKREDKRTSHFMCCDYIGVTGHKRPCKPTPDCICYTKGKKAKRRFDYGRGRYINYNLEDKK